MDEKQKVKPTFKTDGHHVAHYNAARYTAQSNSALCTLHKNNFYSFNLKLVQGEKESVLQIDDSMIKAMFKAISLYINEEYKLEGDAT